MAITPGTDVTIQDEPLPRGPIVEPGGGISRQFFNWFQGKDRKLGEIISGVNLNRQNIVQLETDYQAADGTLSSAYIAADAVVFANSEASNATLSTNLTAAFQAADTTVTNAYIAADSVVSSNASSALASATTSLTAAYQAADSTLQGQITTNAGNITTAQADITTLQSTTASNTGAISTLTTNLSAEVTNRTNADTALQGQITTNAGNITTNAAAITTEATARASGDAAEASARQTLEAKTLNANPNLIPNGGFANGTEGWTLASGAGVFSNFWGSYFSHPLTNGTNASYVIVTDGITPTAQYVLSADFVAFASSGNVYCDIIWLDSSNNTLLDDGGPVATLGQDFGNRKAAILTAPANAAKAAVRFVTESIVSATALAVRRIKLERGTIETAWSDEDSLRGSYAAITTEATTRSSADAANASLITTLEAKVDTKARTFVQTSAPSATATGDLWVDSDDDNKLYRWDGSSWVAVDDGRISTNVAAITTEATARASGDAANATAITTLRGQIGGDGSPIPDWNYRDSDFWNLPSGVNFAEGNPFTGVIRSIAMPDGTYDFSSDYWRVEPGATYEIVFRWWNGFGTFSGYVRPALHIPGVMWQSLRSGSAISNISSATGDQTGDIIAGSSSGTDIYRYTIPSSVTQIQTRLKASFSGNVNFYWALEMKKLPQFAEVTNIAEAYATNDSATARLVWKVDTSTNAATIEQTAATGYSDGTWNGSAIKLSANLIELLAEDINFGTNTTYEDTYATLYTEKNSKRLRILGPFPASDDLVMWFGPTTVALNSETKTNGHFCLATDGKIYLGSAELTNSGNLDFTYTNGFVKTRNGNGTVTTDSVSFTGSGGSGSGYTFAHELIVTYTTGPTVTLSNTTGSPITASATGVVGDEVRFFVQTTMTDSAGNKVTKSKGGGLFWDI